VDKKFLRPPFLYYNGGREDWGINLYKNQIKIIFWEFHLSFRNTTYFWDTINFKNHAIACSKDLQYFLKH
jgi:hypothetical protein